MKAVALIILAAFPVTAGTIYSITGLGTLGGGTSVAYAIDAAGRAAGGARTPNQEDHAFLWAGGMTDLSGTWGQANGISSRGVVGTVYTDLGARAMLWQGGVTTMLGALGGAASYATAINESGQVAGSAETAAGQAHAFLYTAGVMQDLGLLAGGTWSSAYAVNDSGQVAGYADTAPGVFRAFSWTAGGGMQALGTLGGTNSYAFALNGAGQMAGTSNTTSGYTHAFLHSGGQMLDLGTLGGRSSYAYGVNAAGHVVGHSWVAGGGTHAYLYRDGVMTDLNSLLQGGAGWELTEAYGINDLEQIVGAGLLEGQYRAFRLDPLASAPGPATIHNPEPGTLGMLAAGASVLALMQCRGRRRV